MRARFRRAVGAAVLGIMLSLAFGVAAPAAQSVPVIVGAVQSPTTGALRGLAVGAHRGRHCRTPRRAGARTRPPITTVISRHQHGQPDHPYHRRSEGVLPHGGVRGLRRIHSEHLRRDCLVGQQEHEWTVHRGSRECHLRRQRQRQRQFSVPVRRIDKPCKPAVHRLDLGRGNAAQQSVRRVRGDRYDDRWHPIRRGCGPGMPERATLP